MVSCIDLPRLPVIDLSLFEIGDPWRDQVAAQIDAASGDFGLFYVVGHGIDAGVVAPLMDAGRRFFAAEPAVKRRVKMAEDEHGRHGYLAPAEAPNADGLECQEGLYFAAQLTPDYSHLPPGRAARGQVFLPDVPGFRDPVLDYMRCVSGLCHKLMALIARSLRLPDSYFVDRYTGNPATSLRIFNYPRVTRARAADESASAAARTDPGLLTVWTQDSSGGLEVRFRDRWIDVPDLPDSFVCNVGEALVSLTNGRYVAAAHRVTNDTRGHRLAMPFCFGPSCDAVLEPIAAIAPRVARAQLSEAAPEALLQSALRHLA